MDFHPFIYKVFCEIRKIKINYLACYLRAAAKSLMRLSYSKLYRNLS